MSLEVFDKERLSELSTIRHSVVFRVQEVCASVELHLRLSWRLMTRLAEKTE